VGSAADIWRTADAWDRSRPINRGEVHDHAAGPALEGWKTFPRNHAAGIASLDLFVVRTMACAAIRQALSAAAIRAPTTSPETRVAFRIVFSAREL
jgi:hypothetical protein